MPLNTLSNNTYIRLPVRHCPPPSQKQTGGQVLRTYFLSLNVPAQLFLNEVQFSLSDLHGLTGIVLKVENDKTTLTLAESTREVFGRGSSTVSSESGILTS